MGVTARRIIHCGVWNTCPECGHYGERVEPLCSRCRPRTAAPRPKKIRCPECGHLGQRPEPLCQRCRWRHDPPKQSPVCPTCGGRKHYNGKGCRSCAIAAGTYFRYTPEEDEVIRQFYPTEGSAGVMARIGKTRSAISSRARQFGINVIPEVIPRIAAKVHGERMRTDNPSHRPGAAERIGRRMRADYKRPEYAARMAEIRARSQRDKPSGLERQLWAILDEIGIAYETQAVIKRSFVVDIRIGRLIIEADGDWWHGHPRFEPLNERQRAQQKRDTSRNAYLRACGYTVVRVWESDMDAALIRRVLAEHNAILQG